MSTARLLLLLWCVLPGAASAAPDLSRIRLPPGFTIDLYTDEVPGARSLALGAHGIVFVATRDQGKVYALDEENGVRRTRLIARDLEEPNGIAFFNGDLYVAERHRILRYRAIESHLKAPPDPQVIYDRLPTERSHGWRYLGVDPEGWLYVSIGVPCNICLRKGFGNIARLRPDGSHFEIFADGVRNSVGFDWHPTTRELWFTDNGRDWLADDAPPDELNRAPRAGLHFGFPFCHGGTIVDPEFGRDRACSEFTPPAQNLGPHVAALGMRFYTGTQFPPGYRQQIFIAEHGSWNRSRKIGYRVMLVRLEGNRAVGYEEFAAGWLDESGSVHGRPVDLLVMPDGALLVSDDMVGAIYRISYSETTARK